MRIWRRFSSIFERVLDAGGYGAGYSLVIAMIIIVIDVILRYGFNKPIAWSTQVCSYALLGAIFMGIAYLQREKGHVTIDFIINTMNKRVRALIRCITLGLSALVMIVLTYYSAVLSLSYFQRNIVTMHTIAVPKGILTGLLGLGFFVMIFEFGRESYRHLKDWQAPAYTDKTPQKHS